MLKKGVKELLDRYEYGDEDGGWLSAADVKEELEQVMDDCPYDDEVSPKLEEALRDYVLDVYAAERTGGREIPDEDKFIGAIKAAVGYED